MKLSRALNLVIPIDRDDGSTVYVHAMPISMEVFNEHFLVIARTSAALWGLNLGLTAGPRVAAKMLRNTAKTLQVENETLNLTNEITRLSNVVVPSEGGYKTIPLFSALKEDGLSKDDYEEVENILVFFTVLSAMQPKKTLEPLLRETASLWGGQIESLNCTDYANSLRTSTGAASSGGTVAG